jgi:hypothetical protein
MSVQNSWINFTAFYGYTDERSIVHKYTCTCTLRHIFHKIPVSQLYFPKKVKSRVFVIFHLYFVATVILFPFSLNNTF